VLDALPKESEWRSWCYVALGVLVIYCTIPVARAIQEAVSEQVGKLLFLYFTVALVLIAGTVALGNLRKRKLPISAYIWLFGIIAAFMAYIYTLRDIPEEAIHVAEYGVFSILVYRALVHRIRDFSIYIIATLVVGMVGVLDEYIQWIVPTRYFDLRDITINILSGGMAQLAIVAGLRPKMISGMPEANSWSRLCYFAVVGIVLLALGFMNTPQRLTRYVTLVPFLSFLLDSKSMMVEYGYRYHDRDIGIFRSRFSLDQLNQLDQERGAAVAKILDRYIRGEGYGPFQSVYTVPRDAYAHEAGVHLYRREYHFDRAREKIGRQAEHYNIAFRENQILEKYYTASLQNSSHHWNPEVALEVSSKALKTSAFESPVSADIITRFSERQVISLFMVAIVVLLILGFRTGSFRKKK